MPFSHQHTPWYYDPQRASDPGTLGQLNQMPSNVNRTILGIPADDDEYTRGLIFFDPSIGQSSTLSRSEESEDPRETPPYEPSQSSNNTSSRKVYTPQSDSDNSAGFIHRALSSQSGGSADGESGLSQAEHPHPPSVSVCATFGTSDAASSPKSFVERDDQPTAENFSATTMSSPVNLWFSGYPGPSEHTSNIRAGFNLEQDDIDYLENMMSQDTRYDSVHQRRGSRTTRTPKAAGPRLDPMGLRASTKSRIDRAQIEKVKMMRRIGVCLPCLVNHEPVRI